MKKIVLASLMTVAMGGAFAQAYVGGSFGPTHLETDCAGTYSCDNDDTGYKLYAGYKLNHIFAVEAGYMNFGKASAGATVGFTNVDMSVKSDAPFVVGAARGDFTPQLAGVARLGIADVKSTVNTNIGYSSSDTKAQALFGLALEYAFTKNFKGSVDADFTKSADIAGESGGSIRMISIGAQYHF